MATTAKRSASAPRYPEKKWGPFHGGVSVAVWLNEVQTDAGPKFVRSNVVWPVMGRRLKAPVAGPDVACIGSHRNELAAAPRSPLDGEQVGMSNRE